MGRLGYWDCKMDREVADSIEVVESIVVDGWRSNWAEG
jgi:hypothetical protein